VTFWKAGSCDWLKCVFETSVPFSVFSLTQYSCRYAFVLINHESSFVERVRKVGELFSGFLAMGSEEFPWIG